jgi:hypothetical protein
LTTFKAAGNSSKTYGVVDILDKEGGVSLKYVDKGTMFLEIDFSKIMQNYAAKNPSEAKRLLAMMTL